MTFRRLPYYDDGIYRGRFEEPAPLTFREPQYYNDGYYRRTYEEPAPITFRDPPYYRHPPYYQELPYYDNGYYNRIRRQDQYPVFSHGGHLPHEQVLVRVEDPPLSWSDNPGYPYARCYVECPPHRTTVELYVPQLYSDHRERRVMKRLEDMEGVTRVTADQVEKKVVVVGHNLCPNDVLRRLRKDLDMKRSVLWHDR